MLKIDRVVQEITANWANVTGGRPYLPLAGGRLSRHKRTALRQTKESSEGKRVTHHLLNGITLNVHQKVQKLESIQLMPN